MELEWEVGIILKMEILLIQSSATLRFRVYVQLIIATFSSLLDKFSNLALTDDTNSHCWRLSDVEFQQDSKDYYNKPKYRIFLLNTGNYIGRDLIQLKPTRNAEFFTTFQQF